MGEKIVIYIRTKAFTITDFTVGMIGIIAAIYTTCKVYKGSKSKFAYVLMAFALGFGITDCVQFLTNSLCHIVPEMPKP